MSLKYGITCNVCGRVSKWTNTPLTSCPTNPAHEVNIDSVSIEETARATVPASTIVRNNTREYNPTHSYVTQGLVFFSVSKSLPIYVKLVTSVESGNYQFRFIDVFNRTLYYESPVLTNNTPEFRTVTISDIINPPLGETCVDIEFKSSESTVTIRCSVSYVTQV